VDGVIYPSFPQWNLDHRPLPVAFHRHFVDGGMLRWSFLGGWALGRWRDSLRAVYVALSLKRIVQSYTARVSGEQETSDRNARSCGSCSPTPHLVGPAAGSTRCAVSESPVFDGYPVHRPGTGSQLYVALATYHIDRFVGTDSFPRWMQPNVLRSRGSLSPIQISRLMPTRGDHGITASV